MLLLFDIDGTLLRTQGAGVRALEEALRSAFPILKEEDLPSLSMAGGTDTGIVKELFTHFEIEFNEPNTQKFFSAYTNHLEINLKNPTFPGKLLPGTRELLETLRQETEHTLGLLTGNLKKGAQLKLQHFGIDHFFPFGAFADDHADRNKLGPIALQRAQGVAGISFQHKEVYIIGDTPKDIACGKAIHAQTIAVTTGQYTREALAEHTPDYIVENLSALLPILETPSATTPY